LKDFPLKSLERLTATLIHRRRSLLQPIDHRASQPAKLQAGSCREAAALLPRGCLAPRRGEGREMS